ncbi:hypothetical protein B0H12DRAFT_1157853 [Mycena haematopus]|nr:hypothetical protein B0H12DRAFT_1157853 [Mycena haematopus]
MYQGSTTSNECSDQISAESDELIDIYVIADQDPKRGDINFLSIGPPAFLLSPLLRHFFVDPRLWGLVRIPRCWTSLCKHDLISRTSYDPILPSERHFKILFINL